MTTGASIDPTILAVPPGGEASCELTVDNRSDIVEGYRLEVLGDAARWASVEPATLSVYPGGNATARVVFRIPRSSAVPAAEVPFAVRVLPVERPDTAVTAESARRSSFAVWADGSWRSAATARRWDKQPGQRQCDGQQQPGPQPGR